MTMLCWYYCQCNIYRISHSLWRYIWFLSEFCVLRLGDRNHLISWIKNYITSQTMRHSVYHMFNYVLMCIYFFIGFFNTKSYTILIEIQKICCNVLIDIVLSKIDYRTWVIATEYWAKHVISHNHIKHLCQIRWRWSGKVNFYKDMQKFKMFKKIFIFAVFLF